MEIKKSLALLAGAGALLAFTPTVSHAQADAGGAAAGPFADVPADHWAYNAVKTLQDAKIVIGYPDGTYGGRRPMTRYEFATAIARLLPLLNPQATPPPGVTPEDLAALRSDLEARLTKDEAALDALTRLVNEFQPELQRLGQDVTAIQTRLANLEGRVAAVEAEQQRFRVTGEVNFITDATNSTHKVSDGSYVPFFDKNGVSQGFANGPGTTAGLGTGGGSTTRPTVASNDFFNSTDVYHDILLHLKGKLTDTASANVDLDFENYISNLGNTARAGEAGPIGGLGNGGFTLSENGLNAGGGYSTYVYQAYLDAPVSLGPLGGASLKIGRFGTQFTKWTLMQQNADIYTHLTQNDSGNLLTDGGWLGFKLGPVGVQGFAGKFNTTPFSQAYVGTATNPSGSTFTNIIGGVTTINGTALGSGAGSQIGAHPRGTFTSLGGSINNAAPINQGAGFRATIGSPESLVLGANVEQFAVGNTFTGNGLANNGPTNTNAAQDGYIDPDSGHIFNRVSVYGLDLNGGLPFAFLGAKKNAITVSGAYTVSAEGANSGFNNVGNKARFQSHEELAGFNLAKLNLQAGYQFVGPYFSAPGYWGKIGDWTNPTNVKGPVYFAKYPLTPKLSLNADYEQYRAAYGTNDNGSPVTSPINGKDHINRYQVGVGYGLTANYAVDLGYERVQYDLRGGNDSLGTDASGNAIHGKPTEDYITIGVGHSINQNASFKLLYQIVHYNDRGTGFGETTGLGAGADNNYSGNEAVGQFSLKF